MKGNDAIRVERIPLLTRGTWILVALMAVGGGAMAYRFARGLGASTHLSDHYPWGLWVGMDILVGVALAAGGFTITAGIHILGMRRYRPVARAAVLTAFLGYCLVIMGEIVDIGKPLAFWHPLVMWQHHSVLFEVVWCIALYTLVLALEFSPSLLEGVGRHAAARVLRRKAVVLPLVIAGVTLSFHHQSSLGNLFLIVPEKLHPLWYSPRIGLLFFLSAVAAGLSMVSFQSMASSWALKRGYETEILRGLARGTTWALLVYLAARLADLAWRGGVALLWAPGTATRLFWFEVGVGVLLPLPVLAWAGWRRGGVPLLLSGQVLVLLGVVLNRFDTNFLAQASHGGTYFPSWMEVAVTLGLIALGVFVYRLAVLRLPVFPRVEAGARPA